MRARRIDPWRHLCRAASSCHVADHPVPYMRSGPRRRSVPSAAAVPRGSSLDATASAGLVMTSSLAGLPRPGRRRRSRPRWSGQSPASAITWYPLIVIVMAWPLLVVLGSFDCCRFRRAWPGACSAPPASAARDSPDPQYRPCRAWRESDAPRTRTRAALRGASCLSLACGCTGLSGEVALEVLPLGGRAEQRSRWPLPCRRAARVTRGGEGPRGASSRLRADWRGLAASGGSSVR